MKATTLFTSAILVAGGAITSSALFASASGPFVPAGAAVTTAQDKTPFDALTAEYAAAYADFREKLSAADKKARKALRAKAPITEYWPRFEAMAQGGEGRALVWLADNMKSNRAIKSKQRAAALKPIYTALAADHVNADWCEGALKSFSRDAGKLGLDTSSALIDGMLEKAKADKTKAAVLFHGATALKKDAPEKAEAMMERILEEFGDTKYAMHARAANAKPEASEVGKVAPNFMARSIDGFEFSLEDYRGKVTVLDFYGFW